METCAEALWVRLEQLQAQAPDQRDADWLSRWSQIKCEIQSLWGGIFMALKLNSNDKDAGAAHTRFMEYWVPKFNRVDQLLAGQVLESGRPQVPPVIYKHLKAEIDDPTNEDIDLTVARQSAIYIEYDKITSNQTVEYQGETLSLKLARANLEVTTSRLERHALWQAIQKTEQEDRLKLDTLQNKLMHVRNQIAAQAGCLHYADYAWKESSREYTPQEAIGFLKEVDDVFADVMVRADRNRAQCLGTALLLPWDLAVRLTPPSDSLTEVEYIQIASDCLDKIDPEFSKLIGQLQGAGQLDLMPRIGKVGVNATLHFMATGESAIMSHLTGDVASFRPLFHELGHAIHSYSLSSNPDNLFWNLVNFMETREFFAFVFQFLGSLELLQHPALTETDRRWYRQFMVEDVTNRLRDVNERLRTELWIYAQPEPRTISEIETYYRVMYRRPGVDWSHHADALTRQWQMPQLFSKAFYNIEYTIAVVAALLFIRDYQQRPQECMAQLKRAMLMGMVDGPSAIFATLGFQWPFTQKQLNAARDTLLEWTDPKDFREEVGAVSSNPERRSRAASDVEQGASLRE